MRQTASPAACVTLRCVQAALALSAAIGFASAPARAASASSSDVHKVALYIESGTADVIRGAIEYGLPKEIEASDAKQFRAALKKTGRLPLGSVTNAPAVGRRVGKACKVAKVDAVVVVVVETKPQRNAHVLLFRCGQPEPLQDEHVPLAPKRNGGRDAKAIADAVNPQLQELAPPPPAPAKPAEPEPGEEEAEEEAEPAEKEPADEPEKEKAEEPPTPAEEPSDVERSFLTSRVTIGLGGGFTGRRFGYHQRLSALRRYSIGGFPTLAIWANAYPFARKQDALRGLGLGLSYSRALPFESAADGGTKIKTYFSTFDAALKYRIALSPRSALTLAPSFGFQDFTFLGAGELASEVAAARYRYIRGGVEARIGVGPVGVLLGAGYRFVLSAKPIENRFPHSSVAGIDGRLGAAIPLGKSGFEFFALARYERFFWSMHSEPTDRLVAGGAVDQFFGGDLGFSYGF